jgi:hypothetical protein
LVGEEPPIYLRMQVPPHATNFDGLHVSRPRINNVSKAALQASRYVRRDLPKGLVGLAGLSVVTLFDVGARARHLQRGDLGYVTISL